MKRLLAVTLALLWIPTVFAAGKSTNYIIPSDVAPSGGGDTAKSTNYVLQDTVGEIGVGPSQSATYSLNGGYRQLTTISLSGSTVVSLGSIVSSGQATASGSWVVKTDSPNGYSLSWTAASATMSDGTHTLAAYAPGTPNVPETWSVSVSAAAWGGRLSSRSTDTAAEWGTDGSTDKWLNVATSSRTIVTRSSSTATQGSTEIIAFRSQIGTSYIQPSGAYSVTITLTATAL